MTQPVDPKAIQELDSFAALINNIELMSEEEVAVEYQKSGAAKVASGEIEAMDAAIKALYEAEKAASEAVSPRVTTTVVEEDELDEEMSFSSGDIFIESNSNGTHKLRLGNISLISKSYSVVALNKVKTLLEEGYSFEHPKVVKIVKNIGLQVAAKNTIKESKESYQKHKAAKNTVAMNEQKHIYNNAKVQFESAKKILED